MASNIAYIKREQKRITAIITEKFKNYYLTGGTALSFYFNHRFSEDLDFFTQKYKSKDPDNIMNFISAKTGFKFKLDAEQNEPGLVPMKIYFLGLKRECLVSGVDTGKVISHLDDEVLEKIPEKLI